MDQRSPTTTIVLDPHHRWPWAVAVALAVAVMVTAYSFSPGPSRMPERLATDAGAPGARPGASGASGADTDRVGARQAARRQQAIERVDDELVGPTDTPTFDLVGDPTPSDRMNRTTQVDMLRQEHFGVCMPEHGFEYVPVDFATMGGAAPNPTQFGMDPDAFQRAYGYGYTASLDPELTRGRPVADANTAIQEALTPGERRAYEEAFRACQSEADERYPDPANVPAPAVATLGLLVASDPEVAAETERWSACMARRGHDYPNREALFSNLDARMDPVYRALPASSRAPSAADLPAPLRAELTEIAEVELAVAQADAECKADLDQAVAAAKVDDGEEWVAEHPQLRTLSTPAP